MSVSAAARTRTDQLRRVFAVVPPVTHAAQGVAFAVLAQGDPVYGALSALSVGAVVWFVGCWWLLRRGQAWLATWCIWLEVAVHSAALHAAFGADARFGLYPLILAASSLGLFRADEPRSRWAGFSLALTAGAVEFAFAGRWTPPLTTEPWILHTLGSANAVTAVASGMVFVVVLLAASEKAETEAEAEHQRAETLLRNVLPARVAERLKARPDRIAEQVDDVTVLFADLVGFTPMAATREATEVVALLDRAFTRFDAIAAAHGLEKIKTIGDAYMAVAGLPDAHPDGPAAAAEVALQLVTAVESLSRELGVELRLRVGLHTGPVVAGVIGTHRKAYDLWGDTVNTASRMESHGEPGRVHVSDATASRLRGRFALEPRGVLEIKGKGRLATWWVSK